MMGTFATVLAKNRIPTPSERFQANVTGDIEAVDGVLKIVRIRVHYTLKQECFNQYLVKCPAAQSVIGCIDISHVLEMSDL